MEQQRKLYAAHCVVLAFPGQGLINPMLQYFKLLERRGVKVTIVTAHSFLRKTDEGGLKAAESDKVYLESFKQVGAQTLRELLEKLVNSGFPADCLVFDSILPWALEVAKRFGLVGAFFFTQSCAFKNIYFHVHQGKIE